MLPPLSSVGWEAGEVYAADAYFASMVAHNIELRGRPADREGQYIRVDEYAVTLFWAGQERDFSAMMEDLGGYTEMLKAFMDGLADIADAIPEQE